MSKHLYLFLTLIVLSFQIQAQIPHPALVGYWQNWNDVSAPYIPIDQVDNRYNVIEVSFAIPQFGTDYRMEFIPDQVTPANFISQMQTLQSQGKKVLISIGGATAPVSLNNVVERDSFINSMTRILTNYGFDGMDIDLEGSSLALTGGTINAPIDLPVIHLVEAVKQIMDNYRVNFNRKMLLTMAPETAFVQGGMSAFGSIWGAYLPVIHALRDSMDLLQVQLYNSGSMYGIDGGIYTQGTADFIVAMTEAVIQGFTTGGGTFAGLPASKVAVGLPACTMAAGGGFTDTATVSSAMRYLLGQGPAPGSYTLTNTAGYPGLGGMMTWSMNWDAIATCGGIYEYAENFEHIFSSTTTSIQENAFMQSPQLYPNPSTGDVFIVIPENVKTGSRFLMMDTQGRTVLEERFAGSGRIQLHVKELNRGIYFWWMDGYTGKILLE